MINYDILIIGDNMRYLVKLGELGQKIEYLNKQLSIIDENISNLVTFKDNIIWEGKASVTFSNYCDNYIKELEKIEENILSYIEYLLKYYDNYGNEHLRIKKQFTSLTDEAI